MSQEPNQSPAPPPAKKASLPHLVGNIQVAKILKDHLYKNPASGNIFLDIYVCPTPNSKYGSDYCIYQSVSKEAYDKGVRGGIIGNLKVTDAKPTEDELKDVPF